VLHGNAISTLEAVAIIILVRAGHRRLAIFIAVVHIRPPMIIKVLPRARYAILVTTPLRITKLLRRCLPFTMLITRRRWRRPIVLRNRHASRRQHANHQCRSYQIPQFHIQPFLRSLASYASNALLVCPLSI
jgi:hypothetical protein